MAFDKDLIKQRFSTHLSKYNTLASVQREICKKLSLKIRELIPTGEIKNAIEIGSGTGFLSRELIDIFPDCNWTFNDLTPKSEQYISRLNHNKPISYLWGDGETIDLPENLDLIASASTIQWFDSLESFIKKNSSAHYLALSSFGEDNFSQIKAITNQSLDYLSPEQLKTILERHGYELLYINQYTETLQFSSPLEVLHHIKSTGVNGISRKPWTRHDLKQFTQKYETLEQGKITLSYQPIILIARKASALNK